MKSLKKGEEVFCDPFLRAAGDFKPRPGLSAHDIAMGTPGRLIQRNYELLAGDFQEARDFQKLPDEILCSGAAVGLDSQKRVRHFWSGRDLGWLGFLFSQSRDLAVVILRGAAFLRLDGVRAGDEGRTVFVLGPNSFGLESREGAVAIGRVRFIERKDTASVFFKRPSDSRLENLDVKT